MVHNGDPSHVKLNSSVDFSASLTTSLNLRCSASSCDSAAAGCEWEISTKIGARLPTVELGLAFFEGAGWKLPYCFFYLQLVFSQRGLRLVDASYSFAEVVEDGTDLRLRTKGH